MIDMKLQIILNMIIMVLGLVVAIAPWTFAPVCMIEMRCWLTRDVETALGIGIAVLALVGMYKGME